jgi:hypothetical protein
VSLSITAPRDLKFHEGRQKNSPTARFGNIAQMPNEPVIIKRFEQECFLVEARSIGGYSGSPVFGQEDHHLSARRGTLPAAERDTGTT